MSDICKPSRPEPAREAREFERLIQSVATDGNRAAFGALFEHFSPRIKGYFMRIGLPAAQAEELTQEAMLNVWRKARYFDPLRAGASTWIFTIARNLRIDLLRRERSEHAALAERFETESDVVSADESLTRGERDIRVRDVLTHLSDEQATVVRLSFFSDTPHGEIAAQLGLPLGTVKSRIRLALARLRELLGDIR